MKRSQLNAISRSYSLKRAKENEAQAIERNLEVVFDWQTKYKTLSRFLNASETNIEKCKAEAIEKLTARIEQLEKSGCTSYTIIEARANLEKLNG